MSRALSLALLILAFAAPAWAADPTSLDRRYNGAGWRVASFDGPGGLTPDGRAIFVGADGVAERVGLDGRLDPAFGSGGRTAALVPGLVPEHVAARSDGSSSVVGTLGETAVLARLDAVGAVRDVIDLGRIQPSVVAAAEDGTTYVGHGDAIARIDGGGAVTPTWGRVEGASVEKMSVWGAELVVAASRHLGYESRVYSEYTSDLVRFAADGRVLGQGTEYGAPAALLAHEDGALFADWDCFSHTFITCGAFGFKRYDRTWTREGRVAADDDDAQIDALALERDGDVVAAGRAEDRYGRASSFYLRRYRRGRRVDRTFGRCGGAAPAVPGGGWVRALGVQPSGRIVALLTRHSPAHPGRRDVAVGLRGGDGRRVAVSRPVAAARTAAEMHAGYDGRRSLELTVATAVPARVHVRLTLTRIRFSEREQLLTPERLRAEDLPPVGGTGAASIRGCEREGTVRVRLAPRLLRWLRMRPNHSVDGRVEVVARNRAGTARATGRFNLAGWEL